MIGFLSVQALGLKRDDTFSVTMLGHCIEMYIGDTDAYIGRTQLIIWNNSLFIHNSLFQICVVTHNHSGTDINDKVRGSLNTPALMKMLNTSEPGDHLATPKLEDTSITSLETPLSNQDKMMLETPLRLSLTLECDMYESDVMLDTLSDTSTWSHPARRWNCHRNRLP